MTVDHHGTAGWKQTASPKRTDLLLRQPCDFDDGTGGVDTGVRSEVCENKGSARIASCHISAGKFFHSAEVKLQPLDASE